MPIIVVCRSCHQRFQVSDKFAGRQGPCPKCKATIYIPKPDEEVKIHTPEHSEAGARGASGQLVLKPIARTPTRLLPWQIGVVVGGGIGLLLVALVMRWLPDARNIVGVVGLLLLAAPLAAAGYTFLRDPELEPYAGLTLWLRAGICGAAYAACWGAYLWVRSNGLTSEIWQWAFVGPLFGAAGASAAFTTLDLDWGNSFFHFCFFAGVTALLAAVMGLPVF